MLAKELAYYRAHFRDAVQKDGVICLECGAVFKYLPGHLCKHNLTSHEYRAKWGYNRTTPLERLSTRRKKRRNALSMKLASLSPRGSLQKAIKAKRGRAWPYRPESRLIKTEAARARIAAGFRRADRKVKTVPASRSPRQVPTLRRLSKDDRKVLSLRKKGLWPSQIAQAAGMQLRSVDNRLRRLKEAGFTVPQPTSPRPIPHRKVTDADVMTLVRSGLSVREIAAKAGVANSCVHRRIKRLQIFKKRDRGSLLGYP